MRENWNEMIRKAVEKIAKSEEINESEVTQEMLLKETESFGILHEMACEKNFDEYEYEDFVVYIMEGEYKL